MRLPRTIGRYEFLELLGVGGGGAVYAGREHGELGVTHEVAIKVLGSSHRGHDGWATVAAEARVLSRVAHPCVVPIRDLVLIEDEVLGQVAVLVTPRVRGLKLSTLLHRMRERALLLPLPATLHLLLQLVDTLETVHGACDDQGRPFEMAHRDLKPGNLMISAQGDLRVLGFGLAWEGETPQGQNGGMDREPLRYVGPEQLADQEPDARSDLFSVGAVAFEMLVGEPLVEADRGVLTGGELRSLLEIRLVERLPTLRLQLASDHGLSVSQTEHISDLLVRLLQVDRALRFSHARALSVSLESLAVGQPLRRGRRWLAAVVGGLSVTDESWRPARVSLRQVAETLEEPPPFTERAWWVPLLVILVLGLAAVLLRPRSEPQEIQVVDSLVELPVEKTFSATVEITHVPPLRTARSGARVFRVELTNGGSECVPRIQMRAAAGGAWLTRPMQGRGLSWTLRLEPQELETFVGGVEYWIWCGAGHGSEAQWRSREDPARLTL